MAGDQSFERTRTWVTDENAVLTAALVLVALPGVLLLWQQVDANVRVVFLVTLAVGFLPPYVYRTYWPSRYTPGKALLWGVGAGLVVFAEAAALLVALLAPLGMDLASIVAFVVVAFGNYVLLRLWQRSKTGD